uniref:Uncharacterized protein n=1 Tax=Photinus pyralis TaxID=7054 RepID=A0A1Y1KZZ2_PHOPY
MCLDAEIAKTKKNSHKRFTVSAVEGAFCFSNFAHLYKKIRNFVNIRGIREVKAAIERGRTRLFYDTFTSPKKSKASPGEVVEKKMKLLTKMGAKRALAGGIPGTFRY